MKWYHYVMCFFGGAFVANFIPHFVEGITGNAFPWAGNPPPNVSPSTTNILWGLSNLIVGYLLLRFGKFRIAGAWVPLAVTFVGFALMAYMLAGAFTQVPGVRPA